MRYVIVGHGQFPAGLVSAAEMICGSLDIHTVNLDDSGIEDFTTRLTDLLTGDEPTLVLADLLGGSPFNAVAEYIHTHDTGDRITLISGANLPLLLDIVTTGARDVAQSVTRAAPAALAVEQPDTSDADEEL